jgi:hypothetical protein
VKIISIPENLANFLEEKLLPNFVKAFAGLPVSDLYLISPETEFARGSE